jgi:hypothetical protein
MIDFLSGAVAFAHLTAAGFFLRFWLRRSDRLFLWFALAFALFAIHQALSFAFSVVSEAQGFFYGLRVLGFVVILAAIIDKNVSSRG